MWLLREDVARSIAQAQSAGLSISAEKRQEFIAQNTAALSGVAEPRSYKAAGDVAEIRVEGVLTPRPDILAFIFGGGNTTYEDLTASFGRALAEPGIKRVALNINSPGGAMDGLYELLAVLEAFPKPIEVTASEACSAAYMIAAVAGPIKATSPAAKFGSVGVVGKIPLDEKTVEITNTESPKKRPDVTTEEGKATVREYVDAVFDLFVDAIAHGRKTTRADVIENFGRGATLLAGEAKRLGMIDKVATQPLRAVSKSRVAAEETMDLQSFKTTHPELYQAVLLEGKATATVPQAAPAIAVNSNAAPGGGVEKTMDLKTLKLQHPEAYEAAVQDGIKSERERVIGHLNMAEQCGDLQLAGEGIKSGEPIHNQVWLSKYLGAGMNRNARAARQTETDTAGQAVAGATTTASTADKSDQVADLVEQMLGKKKAG